MYTSIKNIPVSNYFEFKKNATIYLCNGGVYQKSLREKVAHIINMMRADESHSDISTYLSSLYVSEIEDMLVSKGELFVWKAYYQLLEPNEEPTRSYSEAAGEVKSMFDEFSGEVRPYTRSSSVDMVRVMARYRNDLIKYIDTLFVDADKADDILYRLNLFFISEIDYINIDPSSRDYFCDIFDEKFTRWYQALGWSSKVSMEGVTAFEFLQKNISMIEKYEKNGQKEDKKG